MWGGRGLVVGMAALACFGAQGALVHADAKVLRGRVSVRAQVSYGPSSVTLSRLAAITVPGANPAPYEAPETFVPQAVAGSGMTVAVGGINADVIYAYSKPAAGWGAAGPPAQLTVTNGLPQDDLAASDQAVLAVAQTGSGSGELTPMEAVLFARPGSGWSGTLQQSAILAAPTSDFGPYGGSLLAISSDTAFTAPGNEVYAFNEPASGWAGTRSPSATLVTDSSTHVRAIASAGRTVAVITGQPLNEQTLDVFTEPAGGWSGTVHPTAVLHIPTDGFPTSVAISGKLVIVDTPIRGQAPGLVVYKEPVGGWSARAKPVALATNGGPVLALAGETAVMLTAYPGSDHFCPCSDALAAFSRLNDADRNATVTSSGAALQLGAGGPTLAATGTDFVASAQNGLNFYAAASPARLPTVRVSQLNSGKPQLRLTSTGSPTLRRLKVRFPATLRLNAHHGQVNVAGGGRHVVTDAHNTLSIALSKPAKELRLSLSRGAITESSVLRKRLHQLYVDASSRRDQTTVKLKLLVRVYDPAGDRTTADLQFTFS